MFLKRLVKKFKYLLPSVAARMVRMPCVDGLGESVKQPASEHRKILGTNVITCILFYFTVAVLRSAAGAVLSLKCGI